MKKESIQLKSLLSTHEAAAFIQASSSSLNKWIADGRLRAHRTPGGHRRILAGDLLDFITAHDMPIPDELQHLVNARQA